MIVSLIVAASNNNVIGKNNRLLWHLPNDMKFFKNTTWAMPIIMGRKTFESLDNKVLPGRFNIIMTNQKNWGANHDKVRVANSLPDAIEFAKQTDCKESYVIGGGQLFAESIAIADKIYMTRVFTSVDGDVYFPEIDQSEFELLSDHPFPADEKHAFAYSFQLWRKRNIKH